MWEAKDKFGYVCKHRLQPAATRTGINLNLTPAKQQGGSSQVQHHVSLGDEWASTDSYTEQGYGGH